MIYKRLTVKRDGTDPRTCADIAKHACRFDSTIVIEYDGRTVSMKSLIGLISLGLKPDSEVIMRFDGEDEQAAADEIVACV